MASCPALSTGEAFLSTTLQHIDCQARTIGAVGYQALADPSSPLAPVLTGLLTLFVALFGLRMMMGDEPTLRDGVMAIVKIGIVLTMATSWPAYRTVIYDVIVEGPSQLASVLGSSTRLPGTESNLASRLQVADAGITRLTSLGTGRQELSPLTPAGQEGLPRAPIADDPAFGTARVLFLASTIAAFAAIQLTAGVLLAVGPLFAGLLLFGIARSFVAGWARALVFTMLASVVITIVLGVELALLEPWLSEVLSLREARAPASSAPVELLILCLGFALALAGSLAIILRLAFAVDVQRVWASASARLHGRLSKATEAPQALAPVAPSPENEPSRARAIAASIAASQRREQASLSDRRVAPSGNRTTQSFSLVGLPDDLVVPTVGQTLRRPKPRQSLGAALRDHRR